MADNLILNPGAGGSTLATDECTVNSVANVHVPWTKLGFGTHDSFTPVTTGAGLPVQDGGGSLSIDDNGASLTVDNAALSVTGGGAESSALRVTIANDSTGVVSIDDNGSSISIDDGGNTITVDGTVSVTGTVTVGSHAVTNAGTFATQIDGAALTALQLIDNIVLAEDAGHVSGDPGVMMLGVRNDSDASLAASDLDYVPMQFDSNGYLKVNIKAGAGSGGSSATDDAAFTAASGSGTPMMGFVSTDAVDANDVGVVRMLTNRQLAVTLHDSSGNEIAVGGGTQYDEDTAHSSGDKVTMAGVVRADTAASPAGSDGDRSCLITDSTGRLWCNVSNTVTVASHAVTNAGTFAVQAAQSGTWNITDISGTVSLPTGASTEAKQDIEIALLQSLDGSLSSIDADTGNIAGCVSGAELQVDVVGALPAGTNNIGDVDVLSVTPGTGAASLGKAIDSVAGSTDTGVAMLAIRDDSLSTLTPADGDWVPMRVSSTGALHVTGGGGGTEYNEDAATPATITGTATMMERDDALSSLTPAEGDWAAMRCDANGALWTAVSGTVAATQSGTWNITNVSGTISLPTGASTLAEQQTQTTALSAIQTSVQLIDDAVGTFGTATYSEASTKGMMIAALRRDTPSTPVGTDNEFGPLQMNSNGQLRVDASAVAVPITDNSGTITVDDGGTSLTVDGSVTATCVGNAAHDAAVSGNPVLTAAEARSSENTAVANGDVARLITDLVGKLITSPYAPSDLTWQGTGSKTDTSDLAVKAAAGSGVRNYITSIIVANTSSTDTTVIVKDGSTEICRVPAPANSGAVLQFPVPLKGTANTAVNIASAASVSTMYITAAGYTGR